VKPRVAIAIGLSEQMLSAPAQGCSLQVRFVAQLASTCDRPRPEIFRLTKLIGTQLELSAALGQSRGI
jgi:hypothetical protein